MVKSKTEERYKDQRRRLTRFEELHTKGPERFGLDWLTANTEATAAAHYLGIDPCTGDTKALLTEACFRILGAFQPMAEPSAPRPRIVCLCGSTRFMGAFQEANLRETMEGRIVLSIGCNTKSDKDVFNGLNPYDARGVKQKLDELHKRKIDLADEVLILNVDGYIGESTRSEIEYAQAHGKEIRFLEMVDPEYFFPDPEKVKLEIG